MAILARHAEADGVWHDEDCPLCEDVKCSCGCHVDEYPADWDGGDEPCFTCGHDDPAPFVTLGDVDDDLAGLDEDLFDDCPFGDACLTCNSPFGPTTGPSAMLRGYPIGSPERPASLGGIPFIGRVE